MTLRKVDDLSGALEDVTARGGVVIVGIVLAPVLLLLLLLALVIVALVAAIVRLVRATR